MLDVDVCCHPSGVGESKREGKLKPPRNVHASNHLPSAFVQCAANHPPNRDMAVLSFSLTPEATGRVYEALVCLAKFGEAVAIEARGDKACLHTRTEHHIPDVIR